MDPVRFTLDNGLRVVLEENHAAKVVALEAWVDVGSATEPQELAGIAHVFEHMLFKGTERRAVGEIARDVEGAGGDINAWTSFDETVYHLVLPSRHFDDGLDILSDVLQHSAFDATELERELKVVLEELKQGEDNPGRVASQTLFSTAYQRHPYRRPVIGTVKTVRSLTRARLLDLYRTHYVANNITLVLCGDFDSKHARRKLETAFGKMRSGEKRKGEPAVEPPQRAPRAKVITSDLREAHVQLAFHIPSVRHADAPALEVLALVLGHGESSRLDSILRRDRESVNEAFAYAYAPRDPGLFVLGATTRPGELEPALDGLLDEALRLGREPVSEEELARARATLEADAIYQKETMQGRARKLGYFETIGMGATGEALYLRAVTTITPADLIAVAQRYFTPENLTLAVVAPPAQAPTAAQLIARIAPAVARATPRPAAPTRSAKNGIIETKLASGARLFVVPDPGSGVVAMRAVFLGGQRYEDARRAGISSLVASLLTRGTRRRSGDELAREVEGIAGALSGFSGRNTFGIAGEFLAKDGNRGLSLLADCVLHPSFREVELERERRRVLEALRTEADHPSTVAFRAFHELLYPKHPYRLPVMGEPRSVATLTRRALVDWHSRYMQPEQMVISIVGDVDPERVRETLDQLFPAPSGRAIEAPRPSRDPLVEDGPRQVFQPMEKRQAHVVYGFPGTTLAAKDRFALELLSTVLGGQSGRLFLEVRDKRGLAYRVSASTVDGIDPGYFAIYVATSPENLGVAVASIEDELEKLRARPVPKAELERAKRYLVGAHDISLQRRASLASVIAFNATYGIGADAHLRYAEEIDKISAAELQRVAALYLDRRRAVIATVRPDDKAPVLARRADGPGRPAADKGGAPAKRPSAGGKRKR